MRWGKCGFFVLKNQAKSATSICTYGEGTAPTLTGLGCGTSKGSLAVLRQKRIRGHYSGNMAGTYVLQDVLVCLTGLLIRPNSSSKRVRSMIFQSWKLFLILARTELLVRAPLSEIYIERYDYAVIL